jgi:ferric-dicitrate binding protein FerR (iron transport regulator)
MQTSHSRLQELFDRWMQNKCTPAEQEQLLELMEQAGPDALPPLLKEAWDALQPQSKLSAAEKDHIVDSILQQSPAEETPRRFRWWAAAAAILVLCIAGGSWYGLQRQSATEAGHNAKAVHDVGPGKEGAILTLANGKTIVLDSLGNGLVASQNGTQVVLNNGSLQYNAEAADDISFNTMTTPRGRKFQLVLPDGSKVWLNAASSLRYPTAFSGKERRVEITGEAYFEVSKNAAMPFIVKINDHTDIQVLGTQFNVQAYADEASIHTTLLEGAVRIRSHEQTRVLSPGQQAQISNSQGDLLVVNQANLEQVTAWKEGYFNFSGASLAVVMRELSRWYDIEVVYEGKIPDQQFEGELPRTLKLSQVIKILTKVDIKFRIEQGHKLVVLP